jgi:hypothetical protein
MFCRVRFGFSIAAGANEVWSLAVASDLFGSDQYVKINQYKLTNFMDLITPKLL